VEPIRISNVAVAHPDYRVAQDEAARLIAEYAGDSRRVAALARGTCIEQRALALPPGAIARLGGAEARNNLYHELAPPIALRAAQAALGETRRADVAALVTTSCTGYTVPGWGVELGERCALPRHAMRLPITESGCAGGIVGIGRAVDYLRAREAHSALVVAAELCSLAFHPGGDEGNIISTLIFGDGSGAALLQRGRGPGLEVLDSLSLLIPGSQAALGFALTDEGFYPLLSRELPALLQGPTKAAMLALLRRNGLERDDIGAWLLHPGGPRVLQLLAHEIGIDEARTRWSWDSLREYGNTSSAAIFDVLRRYFADASPGEYSVAAAFGPGVSIELLLLRAL
jgi:alkylresorcinol/alkylpyrone synthase